MEKRPLGCYTDRMAKDPTKSASDRFNEVCTIRIELRDSEPSIWRQVEVPTSITLKVLHDIVQIVMGWADYHLWEFAIGDRRYGPPSDEDWGATPLADAAKVRLRDVLRSPETVIDYHYDFGDDWELLLTATDIRQGEPGGSYPHYVGGERNGPPEDCGGIPGFYEKLEALGDPDHPDHQEVTEWLGDYDPAQVDTFRIRYFLGGIANRRQAGREAWLKRKGWIRRPIRS